MGWRIIDVSTNDDIKVRISSRNNLKLLEEMTFDIRVGNSAMITHRKVTVPSGFVTDFASIPAFVQWWLPKIHREYMHAAIIHDYLYDKCNQEDVTEVLAADMQMKPRKFADLVFEAACRGTKMWRNKLMYWCLRIGGAHAYNS